MRYRTALHPEFPFFDWERKGNIPTITIQKICNRNKEKEILIDRARPVLKALAPQTPMEIADLLARELLVTESGAETLRRVGDLI